jgi:hypothetical protein
MDVEFPLIKSELEEIDVKLLSAETTLFWNGEGIKANFIGKGFNLGGSNLPTPCPQPPAWRGHFCPWLCMAALAAVVSGLKSKGSCTCLPSQESTHLCYLHTESGETPWAAEGSQGFQTGVPGVWPCLFPTICAQQVHKANACLS